MELERELRYFGTQRCRLLAHHKDQYALIKGDELIGAYTSFEDAFEAGVAKFGNKPFLIKQVLEKDQQIQFPALTAGLITAKIS